MNTTKPQVLVTGANGFIGKTLCLTLHDFGYPVRQAVRTPIEGRPSIVAVGNIGRDTDWAAALDGVHVVIHLAARAHILTDTAGNPLAEFRAVNVEGTKRLARQAVKHNIERLIFVSSIGVLGSRTKSCEAFSDHSIPQPKTLYTIAKWEAEQALQQIHAETGLEIVIVRPPLVYGANAPGNMCRLLKWVYRGIPLPLANTANRRSFIGVDNLVSFLIRCVDSPAAANKTFVVSDQMDLSTTELIHLLADAMNRPTRLFPMPEFAARFAARLIGKENMVDQLWGSLVIDPKKTYEDLNWSPPFTADQGIKKMALAYLEAAPK